MNPNTEAPPTGPVLSAEEFALRLYDCDLLHSVGQQMMDSHEALRATLAHARQRISALGDQKARLQGQLAGGLNRIQELEDERAKAEELRSAFVVSINEQAEFSKRVIDTLRHERDALREGLGVYADSKNFVQGNDWVWLGDDDPTLYAKKVLSGAEHGKGRSDGQKD